MRKVRVLAAGVAALAASALVAACGSDLSTQPSAADAPALRFTPSPIGTYTRNLPPGIYDATVRFTIDPKKDLYVQVGPHYLYIPAGVVCDPATSGYGVSTWMLPCTAATKSITVTAKAYILDRHPVVEFDTHLRFKPSHDVRTDVMLYMRDDNGDARSVINWCAESATSCVDESKIMLGSQLNTRFDGKGLYVYRKIQHFSGYNVTGGRDCDGADCGDGF